MERFPVNLGTHTLYVQGSIDWLNDVREHTDWHAELDLLQPGQLVTGTWRHTEPNGVQRDEKELCLRRILHPLSYSGVFDLGNVYKQEVRYAGGAWHGRWSTSDNGVLNIEFRFRSDWETKLHTLQRSKKRTVESHFKYGIFSGLKYEANWSWHHSLQLQHGINGSYGHVMQLNAQSSSSSSHLGMPVALYAATIRPRGLYDDMHWITWLPERTVWESSYESL